MLQVISFILNCIINFAKMLFTIDIGSGLNLGLLMCIIFIFLPMLIRIVYFLRGDVVEELNQRYDESRPRESFTYSHRDSYDPATGRVRTTHSHIENISTSNRVRGGRSGLARRRLLK